MRLALSEPRFEDDAVARIRGQILTGLKFDAENPDKVATTAWLKRAFGDHPYGSPTKGTLESVEEITADDLRTAMRDGFARDNLKVAVVGDITAEELAPLLDEMFAALPEATSLKPVPEVTLHVPAGDDVVRMEVPQSVARFGLPAYKRHNEDFYAAYVLNYIIGGGGFASRLMEEVREKRGLAYSVFTYLYPLDHTGVMIGGVATKNEAVRTRAWR